ncbi:MAG: protein kinase [Bacillota bacterium]
MSGRSLEKDDGLSLVQLLEGCLSSLLALEAGTNLEPEELRQGGSKLGALLQTGSAEQKQAVELLHIAEIQLLTGSHAAARQTCHRLFSLLQDFHKKRGASPQQRLLLQRIFNRVLEDAGERLFNRGLPEEALAYYEEASARNPKNTELLKKKGRLHYCSGVAGLAEAERLYRKVVELNPHDLDNFENLGRVLEAWSGREKDALFVYREAMSYCRSDLQHIRFYLRLYTLFPEDTDIALRLGKLYRRLGMYSEARRYLEEAWKRSANHWAALDLAWLYLLTNGTRRAAELLERAESAFTAALTEDSSTAGEAFRWKKSYLTGLLHEEEGDYSAAGMCYRAVDPPAPVYWPAQVGLARLALYGGDYREAEKTLRSMPELQRSELEQEYFEICRLMEETVAAEHPLHAAVWRENAGKLDPHYQLKRNIYRRSMGPAFWRKYEIIDIIGDGPVGQVYLGRERARGRKVAVKMLQAEILSDPLSVRRLQGRLKMMRTLDHPGLLVPEEDCYYNGDLYYAMEYMEGGSLTALLRQAPLAPRRLLEIAWQLCLALDYLYRGKKGFFHGAIKPENILFDPAGRLRISDFDLLETITGSKIFSASFTREPSLYKRTFFYAAPERFQWKPSLLGFLAGRRAGGQSPEMVLEGVDHRADLYSLGVMLYELATGFLPNQRADLRSLQSYHCSAIIPSALLLNPAIPLELDRIITGLLQKDPRQRFASPTVVLERLKPLCNSVGNGAPTVPLFQNHPERRGRRSLLENF